MLTRVVYDTLEGYVMTGDRLHTMFLRHVAGMPPEELGQVVARIIGHIAQDREALAALRRQLSPDQLEQLRADDQVEPQPDDQAGQLEQPEPPVQPEKPRGKRS